MKGPVIDLELGQGLLADHGLFLITGPTGAGKSTLLDAICVALYGRTPRLKRKADGLMSKLAGYAWSEVEFECKGEVYRSRWELHRSRKKIDGAIQSPKMFLSKVNEQGEGDIFEEKASKVPEAIQVLTGLDFHRFCRSILLAQGDFDAFLKGDDDEKAELLEKMTGTEVYKDISIRVFEKAKQHQENWQAHLSWEQQHLELKTSREQEAIQEDVRKVEERRLCLTKEKDRLEATFKKLEVKNELESKLKDLEEQKQSHLSKEELPERSRWKNWQKFSGVIFCLDAWEKLQQDGKQLQDLIETRLKEVSECQKKKEHLDKELQTIQKDRELIDVEIKKLEQIYPVYIQQKEQLSKLDKDLDSLEKKVVEGDRALLAAGDELTQVERESRQLEEALLKMKGEYAEIDSPQDLEVRLKGVAKLHQERRSLENDIADKSLTLEQLKTEKETVSKKLEEHKAFREEKAKSLSALKGQYANLGSQDKREELSKFESQGVALQKQTILVDGLLGEWKEYETLCSGLDVESQRWSEARMSYEDQKINFDQESIEIADIQKRLISHQYAEDRLELKDGEACPLCGAEEHRLGVFHEVDSELEKSWQERVRLHEERGQVLLELKHKLTIEQELIANKKEAALKKEEGLLKKAADLALEGHNVAEVSLQLEKIVAEKDKVDQECKTFREVEAERVKLQALILDAEQEEGEAYKLEMELASRHETLIQSYELHKSGVSEKQSELETLQSELNEALRVLRMTDVSDLDQELARGIEDEQEWRRLLKQDPEVQLKKSSLMQKIEVFKLGIEKDTQEKEAVVQARQNKRREFSGLYENVDGFDSDLGKARDKRDRNNSLQGEFKISLKEAELHLARKLEEKLVLEKDLQEFILKEQDAKTSFEKACVEQGSIELNAVKAYRLSEEERESLLVWNQAYEEEGRFIEKDLSETQKALSEMKDLELTPSNDVLEVLLKDLSDILKEQGALQRELEEDEKWRRKHGEHLEKRKVLESLHKEWSLLRQLIGSAEGKVFRKIAQKFTLRFLLKLSNRHLENMLDRYRLVSTSESEMNITLVDRYQGDSIRPLVSLSGGESFMISLALALGLSDLSRGKLKMESLFIDEGFGSLDPNALDQVLEALDRIRQSGRCIGIISHVEALKERIRAQIRVSPLQNGISRIATFEN